MLRKKEEAIKLLEKVPDADVDRIFLEMLHELLCFKEMREKLGLTFSIILLKGDNLLPKEEEEEIRDLLIRSGKTLKMVTGEIDKSYSNKKITPDKKNSASV
jgi:hypothetical protein